MQLADLGRRSLLILITNLLGAATGLAATVAMARYMTPVAVGMFAAAFSAMAIAALVTNLGMDAAHVKRVSQGVPLDKAVGTYRVIKNALIAAFMLVAVVGAILADHLIGFQDSFTLPVLWAVLGFFVFQETRKVYERTFAARQETAKSQVLNVVEFLIKSPLVVLVALLWGHLNGKWVPAAPLVAALAERLHLEGPWSPELGAVLIAAAWSVSMFATYVAGAVMFRRHGYPRGRFDDATARSYLRYAGPVALFVALTVVAARIDALMLAYFWSSFEAGVYYQVYRIITVAIIIPTAIRQLFFPLISEFHGKGQMDAVHEMAVTAQRLVSLVMVLGIMFVLVFADEAIHIVLSDQYLVGAHALMALGAWTLVMALSSISQSVVMGFDKPKWVLYAGLTNVLTNLGLNLIFIPESILGVPLLGLKVTGAALATLLAQVAHFVVVTIMTYKLTGQTYLTRSIWYHLAAALATGTILWFSKAWVVFGGVDRFWELGLVAIFGSVVYLAILMAVREVGRKDWILLVDVFDPAKMRDYVVQELRGQGRKD